MTKSRRVLLKISGEAFSADHASLCPVQIDAIIHEIELGLKAGIQLAMVVGGGNFLRGATVASRQLHRVTADHMGMLATVMNGLALRDALEARGMSVLLMSALPIEGVVQAFDYRLANEALNSRKVVIFSGGTGHPFITTDSAASLRAVEIGADVLLKATKVEGIYDRDPHQFKEAVLFPCLSFEEVLERELAVMDLAAFCQCRDYQIDIRVFNLFKPGALSRALLGEPEGSLVTGKNKKGARAT